MTAPSSHHIWLAPRLCPASHLLWTRSLPGHGSAGWHLQRHHPTWRESSQQHLGVGDLAEVTGEGEGGSQHPGGGCAVLGGIVVSLQPREGAIRGEAEAPGTKEQAEWESRKSEQEDSRAVRVAGLPGTGYKCSSGWRPRPHQHLLPATATSSPSSAMCHTSCSPCCQPACCGSSPCQAACCVPVSCKPVLCLTPSCQSSGCCQPSCQASVCVPVCCRPAVCVVPSCQSSGCCQPCCQSSVCFPVSCGPSCQSSGCCQPSCPTLLCNPVCCGTSSSCCC
ncbi:keratin-associated protein 10-12-like [Cavia porcellus]|uniref:keratin-associated protein 10-12-like n=2 Tax=Cavia porcellus TaxID=10141 RepID=UPI002FE3F94E